MSTGKTVLIVDDEADFCEILQLEFEDAGFKVLTASSGNTALKILDSNPGIDGVISDLKMPDGDGSLVLGVMKAKNPYRPVFILVSGYAEMFHDKAYNLGAEGVFEKPVAADKIVKKMNSILKTVKNRENRSCRRFSASFAVNFKSKDSTYKGKAGNIGRGGMFIQYAGLFPKIGDEIEIEFVEKKKSVISLTGKAIVRWVRVENDKFNPAGFGIEFTSLSKEAKEFIESYSVASQPFIPSGS